MQQGSPAQNNANSSVASPQLNEIESSSSPLLLQPSVTRSENKRDDSRSVSTLILRSFDAWINDLIEFQETRLPTSSREMSIADALYKLEASKDIPVIKLISFNHVNGSPLHYVEFLEQFQVHIHDKPHLTDDTRMVQLKMHVSGDAERTISGLGSQGVMYATALKTLKEHFGQPSVIARAFISKVTERKKISANDRQSLRGFSLDMINCLVTL